MSSVGALSRAESARFGGTPWRSTHVLKTAVLIAVGVVMWTVGWYQVAGRSTMESQAAPTNLAIVGILIAGIGQAVWILDGRRRVGLRRRALVGVATDRPVAAAVVAPVAPGQLYSADGLHLYHRRECPMGQGREWSAMTLAAQQAAGRTPCGVCKP